MKEKTLQYPVHVCTFGPVTKVAVDHELVDEVDGERVQIVGVIRHDALWVKRASGELAALPVRVIWPFVGCGRPEESHSAWRPSRLEPVRS